MSIALPTCEGGDAPPGFFIPSQKEMRIVGNAAVYRVLTADDIDPDITHPNVKDVIQREISRGAKDPAVFRTLGQLHKLHNVIGDRSYHMLGDHMVTICKSASQCADIIDMFVEKFTDEVGAVQAAGGTGVSVEPMEGYDAMCRSFFGYSKQTINACTDLLIEGMKLPGVFPGNMKKAVDAMALLPQCGEAYGRFQLHLDWCRFVTEARNAIEHPTASNWFETRNFMLMPDGTVMKPSYRHHHSNASSSAPQDFLGNAELIMDKLLTLAEASLFEVVLVNFDLPFELSIAKIPEAKRDPNCPARYAAEFATRGSVGDSDAMG